MLFAQIKEDLIASQKSGDSFMVGVLKLILSELSYAQVDNKGGDLSDETVLKVLSKEAKKRKDAIEIYTKISNTEKVESEKAELAVIEKYLPTLMNEEETLAEIAKVAQETSLTGGRLMGAVMGKLRGKVDSVIVQRLVSEKYN